MTITITMTMIITDEKLNQRNNKIDVKDEPNDNPINKSSAIFLCNNNIIFIPN